MIIGLLAKSHADTPQQNGIAEQKNLEVARALMFTTNVPKYHGEQQS